MMDFGKVLAFIDAMNREGVEYITFGAVALNAHGVVRATTDADFFVKPTIENLERLKRALRSIWEDPEIEKIDPLELVGDYPAVAYGPPGEEFTMDFLTRLGEAFLYDDLEWQTVDMEGIGVRVVTPAVLYKMKRDTVRPMDKVDVQRLLVQFPKLEE